MRLCRLDANSILEQLSFRRDFYNTGTPVGFLLLFRAKSDVSHRILVVLSDYFRDKSEHMTSNR